MKQTQPKWHRARRLMGRPPRVRGKYLELLLALSPYLIDALLYRQRRYRRHMPRKADSWRRFIAGHRPGRGRRPR